MGIWTSAFFCGLWVLTWLPLVCIVRVIWISTNHVSFNVIAQGDERERKRGVIQKGLNPPQPPPPPPNSLHPSLLRKRKKEKKKKEAAASVSGFWRVAIARLLCRVPLRPYSLFTFLMRGAVPLPLDWQLHAASAGGAGEDLWLFGWECWRGTGGGGKELRGFFSLFTS